MNVGRTTAAGCIAMAAAMLAACHRDAGDPLTGTGTVEIVETDVATTIPARVVRVWVHEGDEVRVGDTLVSLTRSSVIPDVDAQRARVALAEARLRELEAGARPAELRRAEAELAAAEADADRAARDLARVTPLAARGTASVQQLDAARAAAAAAAGRRDAARQALELLRQGARPERIAAARAEVANARAALAAAVGAAGDLVLTAPITGRVLERYAEPGEVLAAGAPALTLGETGRPWVRIYVNQRALPLIRIGDPATAALDDYPDHPFAGRVVAINDKAEYTPRVALTEKERADLLFGVKVALTDTSGMLKAGLPVTVRVAGSAGPNATPKGDERAPAVRIPAGS
jgi:HlyD family secretion protein